MREGSDYQISIALMCRDFLRQVEDMPVFIKENDLLDRIIEAIIDQGDEDLFHLTNLQDHLYKYETKLLSLYSRNPDVKHLENLYRRSASLREMCTAFLRKVTEINPGEKG